MYSEVYNLHVFITIFRLKACSQKFELFKAETEFTRKRWEAEEERLRNSLEEQERKVFINLPSLSLIFIIYLYMYLRFLGWRVNGHTQRNQRPDL